MCRLLGGGGVVCGLRDDVVLDPKLQGKAEDLESDRSGVFCCCDLPRLETRSLEFWKESWRRWSETEMGRWDGKKGRQKMNVLMLCATATTYHPQRDTHTTSKRRAMQMKQTVRCSTVLDDLPVNNS